MRAAYELMKLSFSGQETRNVRPASKMLRNIIILANNAPFWHGLCHFQAITMREEEINL